MERILTLFDERQGVTSGWDMLGGKKVGEMHLEISI